MSQQVVTLLLGSNLGDTKKNIEDAIGFLEKRVGEIQKKSNLSHTKPAEFVSSNIFCNGIKHPDPDIWSDTGYFFHLESKYPLFPS